MKDRVRFRLLGPLTATVDDVPLPLPGAAERALLVLLLLDAGRTVSVDALADALWPDAGPVDPSNALQSLVSRLRRAGGKLRTSVA